MQARAAQGYLIDLVPLSDRGLRAEQMYKRFPRNLGETVTSILSVRWGLRVNNSRLSKACSQPWKERTMRTKMVLPSEGNEVRRDAITVVVVPS